MADGQNPYGPQYAQAGVQQDDGLLSRGLGALSGWIAKQGLWGDAAKRAELQKEKDKAAQLAAQQQAAAQRQAAQQQAAQQPQAQGRVSLQYPAPGKKPLSPHFLQQMQYAEDYKVNPEAYITGYRYNENPKLDSPIESMPKYFKVEKLKPFIDAHKLAVNSGIKFEPLSADQLAAMALAEGRQDLGFNRAYDHTKKHLREIYQKMRDLGVGEDQAKFIAAVREKQDVAKRHGISFDEAWNGTGITNDGRTGKQHAERVKNTRTIVPHEKNKKIREFMEKHRAALEAMGLEQTANAAKGGSVDKSLSGGYKII